MKLKPESNIEVSDLRPHARRRVRDPLKALATLADDISASGLRGYARRLRALCSEIKTLAEIHEPTVRGPDIARQVKRFGADSLLPPEPCLSERGRRLSPVRIAKGHKPTKQWFEGYEVREGKDGKPGIYPRDYNVRCATFNRNTYCIQTRLKLLFEYCNAPPEPKPVKRRRKRVIDAGPFGIDCGVQEP